MGIRFKLASTQMTIIRTYVCPGQGRARFHTILSWSGRLWERGTDGDFYGNVNVGFKQGILVPLVFRARLSFIRTAEVRLYASDRFSQYRRKAYLARQVNDYWKETSFCRGSVSRRGGRPHGFVLYPGYHFLLRLFESGNELSLG